MTSGGDELEAFIAALRLSFLTSSSTTGSPESLRQGIEAFRETLRPRSTLATGPSQTEAHAQKRYHGHYSDLGVFDQAEQPISSASTVWSCDEKSGIDALTQQIEFVNTEVREGTSQIRELTQSVKELKTEIHDLRSALAASKHVASSEPCLPSPPPIKTSIADSASSTPIQEAPVDPSPNHRDTSLAEMWARFQGGTPIARSLTPTVTAPSPTPLNAPPTAEPPTRPRIPSPVPPSAPCPVAVSTPVHSQTSASVDQTCFAGPAHPASTYVQGIRVPKADGPKPALSSGKPRGGGCQSASGLEGGNKVATTMGYRACDPSHGGNMEAEAVNDPKVAELRPESPLIATAIGHFFASNKEELGLDKGTKIIILDSPNTPAGWMYGELEVQARRGLILARNVKKVPDPEVKHNGVHASRGSQATEPSLESPALVVAMRDSCGDMPDELQFQIGNRIRILDSPNTPDGWLYGEIIKKRRGLFPARYVTLNKG